MGGPAKALVASREVGGPRASLGGWATRLVDRLASRHERRVRETSAEALERAVAEVDMPLRRGGAAVAIDRPAVAEAAPLLLQVAARLRSPEPLPPDALRLVRSLTGDGAGPLYARSAHRSEYPPGTLGRYARMVLALADASVPLPGSGHLVRG
jgi:hypothetical protein